MYKKACNGLRSVRIWVKWDEQRSHELHAMIITTERTAEGDSKTLVNRGNDKERTMA